uniref:Reticuline oxidase-like protein n=1 Tax=Cajanus cajan TaxID=3821 RepID=A0A151S8V2_CAJCA|nr:Reticuline oxidase-like protein [Cajanus cajan]
MGFFTFFLTTLMLMVSVSQANPQYEYPEIKNFLSCISQSPNAGVSGVTYTQQNASFTSILNLHVHNKRFKTQASAKPLAIITAKSVIQVQVTVTCAKSNGIQIRIRSGGHDYEGLSYVSDVKYVVLDMFPLQSIDVDLKSGTAWVQAGATIGQLYYQIANKSNVHAFPAGVCFTLGTGGHFSGGGYGNLMRKYGLSVDNIIDATLVDVNGYVLNRKTMGEDLFWAIRGGGGASFGVIVAWKIKLVPVPPQVTVFRVKKSVAEVVVSFIGQFLGKINRLLPLVNESFPELGLKQSDCTEMPWVNTTLFWFDLPIGTPIEALLPTDQEPPSIYTKGKSDYVKTPIPKEALNSIWSMMVKVNNMWMQWNPYGGAMDEISSNATPFPHRAGNLFLVQYFTFWPQDGDEAANLNLNKSRSFYQFMTPYVSSSPREVFLNYRDIDVGAKHPSSSKDLDVARTTYGTKFFKENFDRLVAVKTKVDPGNFFTYEQSIPPKSYN